MILWLYSLDGIGEKHDFMRGRKCFLWVNRTIEALQEQENSCRLFYGDMTIIHNVNELGNMLDYANKRNMFFIYHR